MSAQAGMRAINELQPLFGLEVTAAPFVESSRGPVPFRNVVMDYPLARAMEDGFVKEPAVVTHGTEQPEYIPDFVAETDSAIFMVETIELAIKQFDFSWHRRTECGDSNKSF